MTHELKLALMVVPALLMGAWLVYAAIAHRPNRFRLSDYFLAGGKIGPGLTRANVNGGNMALANGVWYFVVLGYFDGGLSILAQITWGLSIFGVGFLVPTILASAKRGETLHGFLGYIFGSPRLRVACAIVTCTGYLLNFGFETYISGSIMSSVLGGNESLKWIFVGALVLATALYISIAGFLGNVSADRTQLFVGIATLLALLVLLCASLFGSRSPMPDGATISPVFLGLSFAKYAGIVAYTSIFNMVDVSNWQSVAANKSLTDANALRELRRSWLKIAVFVVFFPGIIAVAIGCLFRWKQGLTDTQLIGDITAVLLPGAPESLRAIVLGLLMMGLLVLALVYSENLLSAAQFTLMADVFGVSRYDKLVSPDHPDDPEGEDDFVRWCQRRTFLIALGAFALFAIALRQLGEAKVFGFMFIIFGSATSMFPAVVMATIAARKNKKLDDKPSRLSAWLSIFAGYGVSISPIFVPAFTELSPVFTILTSTIVLVAAKIVLAKIMDRRVTK